MPSAIDATKPANNSAALTSDLRANLAAAKSEIEALQAADLTLAPKGLATASGLTMSTNKLLGRKTAGTGALEEITLGTNLSMTGTTLNAAGTSPGGSGSELQYRNGAAFGAVTGSSVSGADVTLTGALALDYGGGTGFNNHLTFNTAGNGKTTIGGYNSYLFVRAGINGATRFAVYSDGRTNRVGPVIPSGNDYRWSSTADATGSPDLGLERISPGLLGFNDGSTAVWRDWKARNGILTGNLALGIVAKSANYTVTANDHTIECDATSGAITLTLPAVSGAQAGTQYTLKKTDASANAVTFDGNASETIDGATTVSTTTQWASITIRRNAAGTAWITTKD